MKKLIEPKMVSIISRTLNKGVTFEEFHKAWEPEGADMATYFGFPVQIIHLANVSNPNDIISIGLLDATEDILFQEAKRLSENEKKRSKKVSTLSQKASDTKLFRVIKIDTLGSSETEKQK